MYDEYMQNYLGFQGNEYPNTYEQSMQFNPFNCTNPNGCRGCNYFNSQSRAYNAQNVNIENFYPEIYKIVYPMVKKACYDHYGMINEDTINKIVNDIYSNLTTNERIELNINLTNEVRVDSKEVKPEDESSQNRNVGSNNILTDLIKILVIRELISRPYYGGQLSRQMSGPALYNPYFNRPNYPFGL